MTTDLKSLINKVTPLQIKIELFKRGEFGFIVEGLDENGNKVSHEKQRQALMLLMSGKYDEVLYGGAAGGAKTWTGCSWVLFMHLAYPGTKSFIGRKELKDLLESVKVTFDKVCKFHGFTDYKFNAQKNFIQFGNGSHINFIEVKYKPSDPLYEDVGSTEYTFGWGEEVGEWHEMAATVLATRVGRHLNAKDHNGNIRKTPIRGTVLWTGNPKQNWSKREFYDKDNNFTLPANKAFLQCLVTENPFIEKSYVEGLRRLADKNVVIFERLFKGNWEYEDNPWQLAHQHMIEQVFDNDHISGGKKYITADAARFGSDKARIGYWQGWDLKEVISLDISKTTDIELAIKLFRRKYKVPKNRCVVDADGIGAGIVDSTGAREFRGNKRPIKVDREKPNYRNIQVQCLYMLADKINAAEIHISADLSGEDKKMIRQELAQIQADGDHDPNKKLDCKSKEQIKQDIGRSPDWRDMMALRVFLDLKKEKPLVTEWS